VPDGQISKNVSCPVFKNISISIGPKSLLYRIPSRALKGRIAIVTDVGAGCGGREGAFDERR
jgi:hypothetical protein